MFIKLAPGFRWPSTMQHSVQAQEGRGGETNLRGKVLQRNRGDWQREQRRQRRRTEGGKEKEEAESDKDKEGEEWQRQRWGVRRLRKQINCIQVK